MKFLTINQTVEWCRLNGFPTDQENLNLRNSLAFGIADGPKYNDYGRTTAFIRRMMTEMFSKSELVLWVHNTEVWPSSGHMPLYTRWRLGLGNKNSIHTQPGHLCLRGEADDATALLLMSIFFYWDCHLFNPEKGYVFFTSHDEYAEFYYQTEADAALFESLKFIRN